MLKVCVQTVDAHFKSLYFLETGSDAWKGWEHMGTGKWKNGSQTGLQVRVIPLSTSAGEEGQRH